MKKDELFDLLGQVDDKFIEEALRDYEEYDGNRPVTALPGKTKITPLKIIAPIAACLAVAVGVGVVIANRDRLTTNTSNDSAAVSGSANYDPAQTLADEEFFEYCKSIVMGESDLASQSRTVWQTRRLDIDFDGEDEFLILPQLDEIAIPEIGVRVFRKTENVAEDLGSFGNYSEGIDLESIRRDEREGASDQYYYCVFRDHLKGEYDGIRFVSYSAEDGKVNGDKNLLRVTDDWWIDSPEIVVTEGTLENNKYKGSEQLFNKKIMEFPEDVADRFCEFNQTEIAKCEENVLRRKGKRELADMLTPGMWHTGEYDINFDGEKELLISLYHFSNLRGVFIYNSDCEYLGSFETEKGLCDPEMLHYDKSDNFWYYCAAEGTDTRGEEGSCSRLERVSINKVLVDRNKFSTERLMHYDIIWNDDTTHSLKGYVYRIGDEEVDEKEFKKAAERYDTNCAGSHGFDLTDPDEWKYSDMFEDSLLTGINKGTSVSPVIDLDGGFAIKVGAVKYEQLDKDKVPVVKHPSEKRDTYNAVITSKEYDGYTIYLIGSDMYKVSGSDAIWATTLQVVLGKDGEGIWIDHVTVVDTNVNLDDMIRILEFDSGNVIAFRFGSGDTYFFRITTDGKIEPVCPKESYDNCVTLSDDFRIEGDTIIDDKNYNYPFHFEF